MIEGGTRPWGEYEILHDVEDCKIKRITVSPLHRLSYQYHNKRDETWVILSGEGIVTIGSEEFVARPAMSFFIARNKSHRVENREKEYPLVFIEIQTGEYFGEDDIVRLEDDYGRVEGEIK